MQPVWHMGATCAETGRTITAATKHASNEMTCNTRLTRLRGIRHLRLAERLEVGQFHRATCRRIAKMRRRSPGNDNALPTRIPDPGRDLGAAFARPGARGVARRPDTVYRRQPVQSRRTAAGATRPRDLRSGTARLERAGAARARPPQLSERTVCALPAGAYEDGSIARGGSSARTRACAVADRLDRRRSTVAAGHSPGIPRSAFGTCVPSDGPRAGRRRRHKG